MKADDCTRFQALVEQRLLEENSRSDAEQALLETHPRLCDACAREAALWARLGQVRQAHARQAHARRAAIEPTDAAAMERLLGRAQERRVSVRRTRLAWMVAPAAAVALLLAVLWVLQPSAGDTLRPGTTGAPPAMAPVAAHLGLVSGTVHLAGRPAVAGQRLRPGEELVTVEGLAVVTFDDDTRVVVEPRSAVTLRRTDRVRVTLRLGRGTATFQVARRPSHARFEVEAPWARVEVLGTLLQVATRPARPLVAVAQGRVQVARGSGEVVILTAGTQVGPDGPARALTGTRRAHLLRRLALASLLPTRAGGVLVVRSTPEAADLRLDGRRLGLTPLSVRVVPGDYALSLARVGFASLAESVRLGAADRMQVLRVLRPLQGVAVPPPGVASGPDRAPQPQSRSPTAGGSVAATRKPRAKPGVSAVTRPGTVAHAGPATLAALLQEIRARRARGDWRGAVAGYQTLRRLHRGAPEARTCLVLMGQIQLRHLGQARAALASFEGYLRRGGSLAPEAAWGRIRALARLGRHVAARTACLRFLKRYPSSLYAPQVRARLRRLPAPKKK